MLYSHYDERTTNGNNEHAMHTVFDQSIGRCPMATKESHAYNINNMTFVLKGKLYTMTADVSTLNPSEKLAFLIGSMNMGQDSYASLTKDKGFTDEQRAERAQETIDAINAGTYKKERAERQTVEKVGNSIASAAVKFYANKYDELTTDELASLQKFMPEQYAAVMEWLK